MSNLKIALIVTAIVLVAVGISAGMYAEWRSLPVCETLAHYGGTQQRILVDGQWELAREGMVTYEMGTGRCRVGKYLP